MRALQGSGQAVKVPERRALMNPRVRDRMAGGKETGGGEAMKEMLRTAWKRREDTTWRIPPPISSDCCDPSCEASPPHPPQASPLLPSSQ